MTAAVNSKYHVRVVSQLLHVTCCVLRHVGAQEVLMMGPRRPRHLSLISCNN